MLRQPSVVSITYNITVIYNGKRYRANHYGASIYHGKGKPAALTRIELSGSFIMRPSGLLSLHSNLTGKEYRRAFIHRSPVLWLLDFR